LCARFIEPDPAGQAQAELSAKDRKIVEAYLERQVQLRLAKQGGRMIDSASRVHICRHDFPAFAQKAFEIVNPATTFMDNWHIGTIAQALEEMRHGGYRR
jgi:hypothetical protein